MMDIDSLKEWFIGFKAFSDKLNGKKVADIKRLRKLIEDFRPIQSNLEKERRYNTPGYNIFSVLHIAHNEVFGHSAFLADLLDIHGNHQQGKLFYDEFISQLSLPQKKIDFEVSENFFFKVYTEFPVKAYIEKKDGKGCGTGSFELREGRIDILIHYNSPGKRFCIAIENKIYAGDQPDQLELYSTYLERKYTCEFLLLYLTPEGRAPSLGCNGESSLLGYSISKRKYDELENKRLIKLISYNHHINLLLKNTITQIRSNKVAYIISQYLQTIKNNFRNE